jgi:hypothetical protein
MENIDPLVLHTGQSIVVYQVKHYPLINIIYYEVYQLKLLVICVLLGGHDKSLVSDC